MQIYISSSAKNHRTGSTHPIKGATFALWKAFEYRQLADLHLETRGVLVANIRN
jgi:hypothetical protein